MIENNKSEIEKQLNTPLWEKTDDAMGIRPTWEIICTVCSVHRGAHVPMVLRRSRIHQVSDMRIHFGTQVYRPFAFDQAYKCPDCGHYIVFGVAVDTAYALKIKEKRGGKADFLLPEEIWDEDERVKEQLEALGYFGGGGKW